MKQRARDNKTANLGSLACLGTLLLMACGDSDDARGGASPDAKDPAGEMGGLDAGVVAALDASLGAGSDAIDASVSDAAVDASTATSCGGGDTCSPDYPCVPSLTIGFSCQGQRAEWPVPERGTGVAPSYSVTDAPQPSIVVDNITGLVWQRTLPSSYDGCTGRIGVAGDGCSWEEAKRYCAQLQLTDKPWRLPTKIELESIVEPSLFPAFDQRVFFDADLRRARFWTASPSAIGDGHAWNIHVGVGFSLLDPIDEAFRVRCVRSIPQRSGTPDQRYVTDMVQRVVKDVRTTLSWEQAVRPAADPAAALTACSMLGAEWRLPTLKEAQTLIDPTRSVPALDPVFESPKEGWLWTSTRSRSGATRALELGSGMAVDEEAIATVLSDQVMLESYVKCVR